MDHSLLICALADGQGGTSNGAQAARAACDAVWATASRLTPAELFDGRVWSSIIKAADKAAEAAGGYTTLIALAISDDHAAGASCGDSKLFHRRASANELEEWTAHQPKNPPIGSGSASCAVFGDHSVAEGDRILLASDGVWKYCGYAALQASFDLPADSVAAHLRQAILTRGGTSLPDDFSLVLVDAE